MNTTSNISTNRIYPVSTCKMEIISYGYSTSSACNEYFVVYLEMVAIINSFISKQQAIVPTIVSYPYFIIHLLLYN